MKNTGTLFIRNEGVLSLLHARSMQTLGYCLQDLFREPNGCAQRKTKLKTSR
jgi:hypothetical protein